MTQALQVEIHGFSEPGFTAVRDAFEVNFRDHGELGATVTLVVDGRIVVDLWGGFADAARTRPWDEDTIVNVWSATKGITSLATHMLVDRGMLELDQPVAKYWPEFGQAGKQDLPVRMLLTHQAGLPAVDGPLPDGAALDWEYMTGALARQRPFWEPGTKFGYHAVTFGWLLGELIRRIDGRTLRQFVAEEIAGPLDLDFAIGCESSDFSRCADVLYPRGLSGTRPPGSNPAFDDPNSLSMRATYVLINPPVNAPINSAEWRGAEFGAMNGTSNARAIAKFYSVLASGGSAHGVSVIRPETLNQATALAFEGYDDQVALSPYLIRRGLGYTLTESRLADGRDPSAFGHNGAGGSVAFADPKANLGFAYVMNQMWPNDPANPDPRALALVRATYQSLGTS